MSDRFFVGIQVVLFLLSCLYLAVQPDGKAWFCFFVTLAGLLLQLWIHPVLWWRARLTWWLMWHGYHSWYDVMESWHATFTSDWIQYYDLGKSPEQAVVEEKIYGAD